MFTNELDSFIVVCEEKEGWACWMPPIRDFSEEIHFIVVNG
jgi:hypothetical protein